MRQSVRKPKLAYSSPWQTSRPLTAPANISCVSIFYLCSELATCTYISLHQERITPVCPPPTPSTFTSTYMKQQLSSSSFRPHTQPAATRHSHSFTESVNPQQKETRNRIASGISIIELPSSTFDRLAVVRVCINTLSCFVTCSPVTAGSVFNMASSVAAEMSLERMIVCCIYSKHCS